MTTLLAFLFVLGVLVFVHELGHFLVARYHGVRVLTFSLGFGPKILQTKRGDTVYCVSAIPLGGYVKMAGETVEDKREGREDEFLSKTKWQRFQVLIAGPAMNVVLAVVVMTAVLLQGAQVPLFEEGPPVIGSVAEDSPAEAAGILPGDRILTLAGRPVDTWEDLRFAVGERPDREVEVTLRRDGEVRALRVTPVGRGRYNLGDLGVGPEFSPQVIAWSPRATAARDAGIEIGDAIVAVDGQRVTQQSLIDVINGSGGAPLTFEVRREGVTREIAVAPERVGDAWIIGISFSPWEVRIVEPGLFEAFALSFDQNLEWSQLIFRTLWGLLTRETPTSQLVGPVGIAQLSGDAAQGGWAPLFTLMAMISLNLGILNLLPIPILDGGHITVLAMEGIARRDFSVRLKERMLLAGFVVLMTLMVTVIYNDLTRVAWIERLMIWR